MPDGSLLVPAPGLGDVPLNEPVSVDLDPDQRATVTFEPVQQNTRFVLPIVAISKYPDSTYQVETDDNLRYGPASVPPTDIDDLQVTFIPALRFSRQLQVEVSNLGSAARTYHIQPMGWEPTDDGGTR